MLNSYLENEIEELEEFQEEKQSFTVKDIDSAVWVFRKLKAIQAKMDEINSVADNEIARIEKWKQSQIRSQEDTINFFESLLIEYYANKKAEDSKFKFSCPYGKISQRKQQPKYIYQDEEKLLQSLKELQHTDCIKTVENINKDAIKKKFKVVNGCLTDSDGCIIEGVEVMEVAPKISISLS